MTLTVSILLASGHVVRAGTGTSPGQAQGVQTRSHCQGGSRKGQGWEGQPGESSAGGVCGRQCEKESRKEELSQGDSRDRL